MTPFRTSYWHIQPVWVFYLLASVGVGLFAFGIITRLAVWRKGARPLGIPICGRNASKVVVDGLLGRRIFRGDIPAGVMHVLIMWGFLGLFLGTLIISADYWLVHFLKGPFYLWYSLCLDVFGLMLTVGILWAGIRRYVQRVPRLERRPEDLAVVLWLLTVALSGYLVEGSRLAAQSPEWSRWSFAGLWATRLWSGPETSLSMYPYLWWMHAVLSLGFIAYIPFSKLFHVVAAPVGIYLENQPLQTVPVEMKRKDYGVFSFRSVISFDACTRCGRCVEVCPSTGAGEPFSPSDFIVWARGNLRTKSPPVNCCNGINDRLQKKRSLKRVFVAERIWHCTTCRACLEVCPVYVATPDAIRESRSQVVEEGTEMPTLLAQSLKNIYKYNNPWEATRKKRDKWSEGMEVPDLTKEENRNGFCYFVGCTTSMETRAQEQARSFVKILQYVGVPFGTLGKKEPCCGDIARRAGEDGLFEMKMEDCLKLFRRYGIIDVVTSSPHCMNTMRNEYPVFQSLKAAEEGVDFRVRHYTEILRVLIENGTLSFGRPLKARVTYHDPCYLGRHNGIFDAPREVIQAIPGVELVEMNHHRGDSLCCGGGGDRMWQDEMDGDPKMSEIRIREAAATGAETVITACPLCLIMLEDARKTAGLEDTLRVMDLNELVVMALRVAE